MTTKQTKLNDETVAAMTKAAKTHKPAGAKRKPVETPIQKFQDSPVNPAIETNDPNRPDTVEEWKKKLAGQISYLIAHLKPEDAVSAIISRSIEVYYPWYHRILSRQAIANLVLSPLPEPDPDDEIVRSWGMPSAEKPAEGGDWRDRHDDAVAKRREKSEADQTGIIATELLVREFPQLRLAEQYRDTEKVFGEFGFLKVKAQNQASFLQELGPQGDPSLASNQAIVLLEKLQQTAREAGEHHFKPLLLAKVNAKKLWPIIAAARHLPQILEEEKAAGLLVSINEGQGIQYDDSRIKYGILYQDYFKYQTADGEKRMFDRGFIFYDEKEQVLKITGFHGNDDTPVLFEGEMVEHFLYRQAQRSLVMAASPREQPTTSSSETREETAAFAINSIGDAALHRFVEKEIPDWVFQFLEPMFGDDATGGVKLVDLSFDPAVFSSPLKAARSFAMDPGDLLEEMDASDTYAYVGFDVAHRSVFVILKAAGDVAVITLRKRAYVTFVNKSGDLVKNEVSEFSLRLMATAARIDHSK